jgi:hypothetical protein
MSTPFGCNQSARDLRRSVDTTLGTVMFFRQRPFVLCRTKRVERATGRISRFDPKGGPSGPMTLRFQDWLGDCETLACDSRPWAFSGMVGGQPFSAAGRGVWDDSAPCGFLSAIGPVHPTAVQCCDSLGLKLSTAGVYLSKRVDLDWHFGVDLSAFVKAAAEVDW